MITGPHSNGVHATHKPTGTKVRVLDKSIVKAKKLATGYLRSLVAAGEQPKQEVIRKYELDGPSGPFIKDTRTGKRVEGEDVFKVLERGELERISKPEKTE